MKNNWAQALYLASRVTMRRRSLVGALCLLLCVPIALGLDLYEILGVSSSATWSELKQAYRQMSLQYHPDKQTDETRTKMIEEFAKISNAYRVLSNPERREKYDVHGVADDQGLKDFHGVRLTSDETDDSLLSCVGLVFILAVGIISIVVMQRNRTKPLKRRREALQSLIRSRLTKGGDTRFIKAFSKTRKHYVDDPLRAHQD